MASVKISLYFILKSWYEQNLDTKFLRLTDVFFSLRKYLSNKVNRNFQHSVL